MAFLFFSITKEKCDGVLSILLWPSSETYCSAKKLLSDEPCISFSWLHAFHSWTEFLDCGLNFNLYQHGSDFSMIFSVNASTILHFFILNISLSTCLMILLVSKDLLLCHHLCIFWKVWDPQAQWSFFFTWNVSRLDICMLYEAAVWSPWAGDAAAIRERLVVVPSHTRVTQKGNL